MGKKTGREIAKQMLEGYIDAVNRSDGLVAQYEILEELENPTSSQLARMEELEKTDIPEAIAKDKEIKEKVRELIALPGDALPPHCLQVIELRYLGRMEWKDVTFAIYGSREDFLKKLTYYTSRVFKVNGRALDIIGAALDRKMQSSAE